MSNNTKFIGSFTKLSQLPKEFPYEFAFIGRSNVGKSSLLNAIIHRKALAKVSSTPGKTQTINYYAIDQEFYLVDLPGYGYAKVSKKKRAEFKTMIYDYIFQRKTLLCVFVLLDSRIDPMEKDIEFINLLAKKSVPQCLVYTKLDKLKDWERAESKKKYEEALLSYWEELPLSFYTSSKTKEGIMEINTFMSDVIDKQKTSI